MFRTEAAEKIAHWVITQTGSDAGERSEPGSKARGQAQYIARLLEAWDAAEIALQEVQEQFPGSQMELSLPSHIE